VVCPSFLPGCWAFYRRSRQGTAGVGPAERFGKRAVEVFDEVQQPLLQCFGRLKITTPQNTSHYNAEHDFNLVQPRTVFRQVHEAKPVAVVGEKHLPVAIDFKMPALSLWPKVLSSIPSNRAT